MTASRGSLEENRQFFVDGFGIDIYASSVKVELFAPAAMRPATAGTSPVVADVLDEVSTLCMSEIGSSLKPTATLTTYADAGENHTVPPFASRYQVLSGETPDLTVGTEVVANAPSSGPTFGASIIRLDAQSPILWEITP